jgi:hypothetical protein
MRLNHQKPVREAAAPERRRRRKRECEKREKSRQRAECVATAAEYTGESTDD